MDASVIHSCILFLSLTTPDPSKIFPAAEQVVNAIRRRKAKYPEKSYATLMVQEAAKFIHPLQWQRVSPQSRRRMENLPAFNQLVAKLKNLRSRTKIEEYEAFLWSECVGVSIAEISEGLSLTEGTLKYRAYRGLKNWSNLG